MPLIRALILFCIAAGLVPAAGLLFGGEALEVMHAQQASGQPGIPAWYADCIPVDLPEETWQRRRCLHFLSAFTAYYLGWLTFTVIALQTVLAAGMSLWTGRNPYRMARCFGWVSGLFVTIWSLMAVPRFAIIVALAFILNYWMESQLLAGWMVKAAFILPFAFAAILAVSQLGATFRIWRRPRSTGSLGCLALRDEAAGLYRFVEDIARRAGSAPPAWLVVTIDADFSATDAPVRLPDLDEPLEGGVISLSLPMMRLLASEELACIVAHELAHLAGPLTEAKSAWAPAYGALAAEMDADASVWRLPANWYLGLVQALFRAAAAETMRQGEAQADEAAMRVARPAAAAVAFLKAVVASQAMASHANVNFDRLQTGVTLDDLSAEAADLARKALGHIDRQALLTHIRDSYPDDGVEPSVEQRIANFGFSLGDAIDLLSRRTEMDEQPAAVGDLSELERRVTRVVHRFQQAMAGGSGPLPTEEVESMTAFLSR